MSAELTVINSTSTNVTPQIGGLGVDFNSKFFNLKPATVNIVQSNSTEGTKGNLRISETGDEFEEMFVTLLETPTEARSYYVGEAGQLNRTPENLMCFSRDLIEPDKTAKVPQALKCASCTRQDWGPYRAAKDKGAKGEELKKLIPQCDAYYFIRLIDTVYKMPLQMFIRSKSKAEFDKGMENIARQLVLARAQGKNPNIFDVRFKLSTKQITTGAFKSYVINIADVRHVTDEEREAFGEVYHSYIANKQRNAEESVIAESEAQVRASNESIDSQVITAVEGEYLPNQEITI